MKLETPVDAVKRADQDFPESVVSPVTEEYLGSLVGTRREESPVKQDLTEHKDEKDSLVVQDESEDEEKQVRQEPQEALVLQV